MDANQVWAQRAAVLALGITRQNIAHNDKPNRTAQRDSKRRPRKPVIDFLFAGQWGSRANIHD